MAPQAVSYKCLDCGKNVTKSQRSVGCACCNKYFHIQCVKVTIEQHTLMFNNKVFRYICKSCDEMPKICNVQEELKKGFSTLVTFMEKELESKIRESRQILNDHLESGLRQLEDKFQEFLKSQPVADSSNIEAIKSDVKHCFDVVKVVDSAANNRLAWLEQQANIMQRRHNRTNIIIRGLPKKIKQLRAPVLKLCSACNVQATDADIQHCTYFMGGKAVLVKFNSVQVRDAVMINYNKNRRLKLGDILPNTTTNGVRSEVFLNDHLTDEGRKLISICRRLRNNGKITKYTFLNYDIPKARVVLADGNVELFSHKQCVDLLNDIDEYSFLS